MSHNGLYQVTLWDLYVMNFVKGLKVPSWLRILTFKCHSVPFNRFLIEFALYALFVAFIANSQDFILAKGSLR